jgi:hypothetical protein
MALKDNAEEADDFGGYYFSTHFYMPLCKNYRLDNMLLRIRIRQIVEDATTYCSLGIQNAQCN